MTGCCEELGPDLVTAAQVPALRLVRPEPEPAGNLEPDSSVRADIGAVPGEAGHPALKWLRLAFSLGLVGAAAWFLVARSSEIETALRSTSRLDARWVLAAIGFEVVSMIAFGRLQQRLLVLAGSKVPLRTMVSLVLASNALSSTLPGGVAWSTAWEYGQLERWGVKGAVRLWVFLVSGTISGFALFVVAAGGTELAGSKGPVADLRLLALALAGVPVVVWIAGRLWRGPLSSRRAPSLGVSARRDPGPRPVPAETVPAETVPGDTVPEEATAGRTSVRRARELWDRVGSVRISPQEWLRLLGLGVANWVLDGAVLVVSMLAIGVNVPWPDILVIYALTQVTASLPITPGGLGLVEGSLAALLVAYGVGAEPAVATVIVYRLISFWGFIPVGWAAWIGIDFSQHGWPFHRRSGLALAPPVPLVLYQSAPATPPAA
jgi:uncharacterized membrane protein YbhN (UPF0104 family)